MHPAANIKFGWRWLACLVGSGWVGPLHPVAAQSAPTAVRVLGELATAKGKLALAPCGQEAAPLNDATPGQMLTRTVYDLNAQRDGAAFVEVDAVRDASGAWQAVRLRRAYQTGPRCQDPVGTYVWRAENTRQGWRFEANRRQVTLRLRDRRVPLFFPYRPFVRDDRGAWSYAAQKPSEALRVSVHPARCAEPGLAGMFEYRIEIALAGRIYQGCAWLGNPRLP